MMNTAIEVATQDLNVQYADLGTWLTKDHFDGTDIHPTRFGHAVIATRLSGMLQTGSQ